MPVVVFGLCPRKVACNSIGRSFNKGRKRCNSNDLNSKFEIVVGELHAKLGVGTGMRGVRGPPTAQHGPTKNARPDTSIHSFTATLPKVI